MTENEKITGVLGLAERMNDLTLRHVDRLARAVLTADQYDQWLKDCEREDDGELQQELDSDCNEVFSAEYVKVEETIPGIESVDLRLG